MSVNSTYTDAVDWDEVQADLRQRLKALKRGEKGEMAKRLGISPAVLSQLISAYRPITRERAEAIVEALNGKLNYQPEFIPNPTPAPPSRGEGEGGEK